MSSLFLLPIPRDAQPPIDIWKRDEEARQLLNGIVGSMPIVSSFVVTDSNGWELKHISLFNNLI